MYQLRRISLSKAHLPELPLGLSSATWKRLTPTLQQKFMGIAHKKAMGIPLEAAKEPAERAIPTHALINHLSGAKTKVRVLHYGGNGNFHVLGPRDERIIIHRDRLTFIKKSDFGRPFMAQARFGAGAAMGRRQSDVDDIAKSATDLFRAGGKVVATGGLRSVRGVSAAGVGDSDYKAAQLMRMHRSNSKGKELVLRRSSEAVRREIKAAPPVPSKDLVPTRVVVPTRSSPRGLLEMPVRPSALGPRGSVRPEPKPVRATETRKPSERKRKPQEQKVGFRGPSGKVVAAQGVLAAVGGGALGSQVGKADYSEDMYPSSPRGTAAGVVGGAAAAGAGARMLQNSVRMPERTRMLQRRMINSEKTAHLAASRARADLKVAETSGGRGPVARLTRRGEVKRAKNAVIHAEAKLAQSKLQRQFAANHMNLLPMRQGMLRRTGLGVVAGGTALAAGAIARKNKAVS